MGIGKLGTTLAQRAAVWLRASGKSHMLHTKPPVKINIDELRYAPELSKDVAKFSTGEIKLDDELFSFLPWRKGSNLLPPTKTPPPYTPEARRATETFIEKGWIEESLPDGFRTAYGPYRAFDKNGAIKDSYRFLGRGHEFLFFTEDSKGIKRMVKQLEKIFSDNPNLTEEQKAKILYKYVRNCYDNNRIHFVDKFSNDFIPIEYTAACGAGICRHRSFLAKVLGDKLGLHVAMVRGVYTVNPKLDIVESHIWNEVKIKDKWYLMDITQGRFKDLEKFPEFSTLYRHKGS